MPPQLALVAHRGASALAPENTLAAFRRALDYGVAAIESDVRLTRDGHVVLCHDDNLTRLTGRPDKIADLDLATLQAGILGTDPEHGEQRIATLDDLLRCAAGRTRVLLDLKLPPGHEPQLLATLQASAMPETTIVGVRTLESLRAIKALAPQQATLAFGRTLEDVWRLLEEGAEIARLWSPWIDDAALARAAHLGKPIWVMCGSPSKGDVGETTVDELVAYRRLGLTTVLLNDPRLGVAANADTALATPHSAG